MARLRRAIQEDEGSGLEKSLRAASLSLADPQGGLRSADLASLKPAERELVERYHNLVVTLARELASEEGGLDQKKIMDRVSSLFDPNPIRITTAEICRRVRGFGVYEPFESRVFLAGREQSVIVYTELEHFQVVPTDGGLSEVKLAQEVVLYNEADGLVVWQQPRVEVVDQSRNRRRDFFVVQMVRLPARLGVGKYVMKVRVRDLHGDSLDEVTVPIQYVADQALVSGR